MNCSRVISPLRIFFKYSPMPAPNSPCARVESTPDSADRFPTSPAAPSLLMPAFISAAMTVFLLSFSSSEEKSIPASLPMGLMPTTPLMTVPSMEAAPAKSPRRHRAIAPMSLPTRPVSSPSSFKASEINSPMDVQKDFCLLLASLPVFSSIFPKSLEIASNKSVTPFITSPTPSSHVLKTPSQSIPLIKLVVM